VESVPLPPNLHWSLVLIINVVLRFAKLGVGFNAVWNAGPCQMGP